MIGIPLNRPITYAYSSLRFFKKGEHHISRTCPENVLLLVYEGILRFREDGVDYEIGPGQYHIQKQGSIQEGPYASDSPKYMYIHFWSEWTEQEPMLPRSGTYNYAKLKPIIEELHTLRNHTNALHFILAGKFFEILSLLYQKKVSTSLADRIADFIAAQSPQEITIEQLCENFHFSKNHIINIFKKAYGLTPIAYMNHLRLCMAEYRMEVTSESLEQISIRCGFPTYSHFYNLFLRKNGLSPEQWRKEKRIQPNIF